MALAATTLWEIETGGDDTNNGGAFDPGQTSGMFTDGAATSATGTAPVFSSASYNFVAGDVGAWVYIASGTNWTPGWYKIASVASNQATLDAAIGHAVLKILSPTTAAGCATTASPTAATWTVDYSQQTSPKFTYTDLASAGAGLTVSSAGHPFGKQHVGNSLVITSGTNFTAGRYVIASVAAAVATVVGPSNITSGIGSAGHGSLGGALKSPALPPAVAGNRVLIAAGTYTVTTTSSNVANGVIADTVGKTYEGYNAIRGDLGTPPIFKAGGAITGATLLNKSGSGTGDGVVNLVLDGNSQGTMTGFTTNHSPLLSRLKVQNCPSGGILGSGGNGGIGAFCEVTNCGGATAAAMFTSAYCCESHGNSSSGMWISQAAAYCLSYANTGASSDGYVILGSTSTLFANNVAYGNGRHGISLAAGTSSSNAHLIDNIVEGHTAVGAFGYKGSSSVDIVLVNNAAYNNATNVDTATLTGPHVATGVTILSGSPFTNAAGGDFSLNNTAGAGASCRAAGTPGVTPSGTSTGHLDIGAIQHADPVVTSAETATVFVG